MKIEKPKGSRVGVNRRSSFTLIELLVVVTIMLILMGISLKVMGIINRKASIGKTTWIVEQVKNALGSYYSVYGTYPPVEGVTFTYVKSKFSPAPPDMNWKCETGLVYYIFYGAPHNTDSAVAQWQHYLKGPEFESGGSFTNGLVYLGTTWTNESHKIVDAWGSTLRYKGYPPDYQRFHLYSCGPNGADNSGSGDDIGVQGGD